MRTISHFINGQSVTRPGAITSPVYDPSTGQVQALLEHGDAAILAETVAAAKAAQPAWAAIDPLRRARVIFKFKALIEEHRQELIHLMSSEHGKLLSDSNGELQRLRLRTYIGMSGDKLKALADQHAVEAYRLGNQLRFKRSPLDTLLKKGVVRIRSRAGRFAVVAAMLASSMPNKVNRTVYLFPNSQCSRVIGNTDRFTPVPGGVNAGPSTREATKHDRH
jgi:hypothetical protein